MSSPTFPSDFTLTYLAEGAANIVYRIAPPPPSPGTLSASDSQPEFYGPSTPPPDLPPLATDPLYTNKLLRLRKALPNLTSVLADQASFAKHIVPLLAPEHLVEQALVKLPNGLTAACNAELREREAKGSRSPKRHGTYLADEEYGNLVTDMSADGNPHVVTLEFKPKWLAQSPTAPKNARRCRMCALQLKRRHAEVKEGDLSGASHADAGAFCPLRLATSRAEDHDAVAERIASHAKGIGKQREDLRFRVAKWIAETPLLWKLQDLQLKLDPKGVSGVGAVGTEAEKEKLTVAGTLRDCTVFLKVWIAICDGRGC